MRAQLVKVYVQVLRPKIDIQCEQLCGRVAVQVGQ